MKLAKMGARYIYTRRTRLTLIHLQSLKGLCWKEGLEAGLEPREYCA